MIAELTTFTSRKRGNYTETVTLRYIRNFVQRSETKVHWYNLVEEYKWSEIAAIRNFQMKYFTGELLQLQNNS